MTIVDDSVWLKVNEKEIGWKVLRGEMGGIGRDQTNQRGQYAYYRNQIYERQNSNNTQNVWRTEIYTEC